jgi:uncharacterized protein (TIGR03083 family)
VLDTGVYLSALASDSEAVADLAAGHHERRVPACPDWTVADLLGHLGGVYSWVSLIADAGGERPAVSRDQPPEDRGALVSWFRDQRDAVLDALTRREPTEPAWVFVHPEPATIGWWRRRQALETAIHLHDVEQAAGSPGSLQPELASDGVDEVLTELLPGYLARRPVAELQGTLHLHSTDAPGEWYLDFSQPDLEVRREHAKAGTALRGPAEGLFLWAWNRRSAEEAGLEVFGDRTPLDAWPGVRL